MIDAAPVPRSKLASVSMLPVSEEVPLQTMLEEHEKPSQGMSRLERTLIWTIQITIDCQVSSSDEIQMQMIWTKTTKDQLRKRCFTLHHNSSKTSRSHMTIADIQQTRTLLEC